MLRLIGSFAHSSFRLSQLLAQLQAYLPPIKNLNSHYEYFLQHSKPLTAEEEERLQKVLSASPQQEMSGTALWVVPRFGTQSAWGAKAIDILHHVGLTKLDRIERATVYSLELTTPLTVEQTNALLPCIHDRMTESVVTHWQDISALFSHHSPQPLEEILLMTEGKAALVQANQILGLALSNEEIDYLFKQYSILQRNPTDAELMMFAQANSEHCRHKIFKADWIIDGQKKEKSLFGMIQNTYQQHPAGVLSAYCDNAAVIEGAGKQRFYCKDHLYQLIQEPVHLLMKVETHNHPTAIEPFAGAGTGVGGEIRDEGATGCGAKPKAGLTGFSVSDLHIPQLPQPWEGQAHYPSRIATSLEIMLKGPIGGAAFNNEFGRPNLCGYFRTFEQPRAGNKAYSAYGYHKPVMIAGGMGNILAGHVQKQSIPAGALLIVLGGPAMKIGLGGGAASSVAAGSQKEDLDFASVQRQNPEMQRRCQEVIDSCWALGENNPIISIHDVGAGGLANALPELVHDSQRGGHLELRNIPNAELGMTPLEIWCNESQERYVLAIHAQHLPKFIEIAQRERCPYAVLGQATAASHLLVEDQHFGKPAVDLPLSLLFGNTPKLTKHVQTLSRQPAEVVPHSWSLEELISRVLQCPTVADKTFLITIGDRTVGGLTARDQMVGPWQVPVADCAVTATNFVDVTGEAMSMGERAPLAVINPAAASRMSVAEAVLNLLAADIKALSSIRLSCNWMAASDNGEEDANLFAAVQAVGEELCPAWGIVVPVGKDSLSMRTRWQDHRGDYEVFSPVTLVVSAFAPVADIRKTFTPLLETQQETTLLLIDLAAGKKRLGGSVFAQVTQQQGGEVPDVDDLQRMKQFVVILNQLKERNQILAYHDRSDGGLWITLCEMAFASRTGLTIDFSSYVDEWEQEGVAALFNEELGVVIQVPAVDSAEIKVAIQQAGLAVHTVAAINATQQIVVTHQGKTVFSQPRSLLHALWSRTSFYLQQLRDNPFCAQQAYERIVNDADPGITIKAPKPLFAPMVLKGAKPKVAILREQGVNGHVEMAAAFTLAGFDAMDVTMSDLLAGQDLSLYHGLVACGGFSYGDVLGAGSGWANTILYQDRLREIFTAYFHRPDTFTLGVCNGCQMLSQLKDLIPGAAGWPKFVRNLSEQFEARLSLVEVLPSPSILLNDLAGSIIPIITSHGEGRVDFTQCAVSSQLALRYVDNAGSPTEVYPYNPNGSTGGMTGFTTEDGRATIMMPHPERVIKAWQFSWHPIEWEGDSPWMRLFINARKWLE